MRASNESAELMNHQRSSLTFWLALITLAAGMNAHGQDKASQKRSLVLTTSVVKQAYCSNGDLRMSLRLRYTNNGEEAVILRRYGFDVLRYTVSRSQELAEKHQYEQEMDAFLDTFEQPFPTRGREPSPDRFVILKPTEHYEIDTTSDEYLFIHLPKNRTLNPGNHFLQILLITWDEPISLARELEVAWRPFGVLWWRGITSEPMLFKIEKPSSIINCR